MKLSKLFAILLMAMMFINFIVNIFRITRVNKDCNQMTKSFHKVEI